ncbi:MAG: hypothetical protein WCS99_11475, partial [Limisphaerales bacterium]
MLTTEFISAANPASRRLLIALHGLGDSLDGYLWLPGALNLPELNCLLVNAPDEYFGGYSWYPFPNATHADIQRSTRLLSELLDAQRERGFPTEQTTLFGFSQGCLMTVEVGLRYPHRFAGLIGVSGYVHDPERLLREKSPVADRQRLLLTHGTRDPLIPIGPVRQQVRQLQAAGL